MDTRELAQVLIDSLQLSMAPVALGFLDAPPEGVSVFESVVPSACAFWSRAEKGLFFAKAESHENCPVGVLTMGFPISLQVLSNLTDFVSKMCGVSYIGTKEPEQIPRMERARKGILYGPLAEFPTHPDLVLIWVNGRQAMLLEEALGTVCWDNTESVEAFGRPACGALAVSVNESKPTLSFGCAGMRTFTQIPDDKLLASLPGSLLASLPAKLQRTIEANRQMLAFYQQHKAQYGRV
jgi:uncharacterized protein (DUF169 family)